MKKNKNTFWTVVDASGLITPWHIYMTRAEAKEQLDARRTHTDNEGTLRIIKVVVTEVKK